MGVSLQGVPAGGGCLLSWGVCPAGCLPRRGVSAWGVCLPRGVGVSAWGVPAQGVPVQGVSAQRVLAQG